MAKPVTAFTWATDANFSSGPASGNATKINPPGWPNVVQGNVPDLTIVAEFQNTALNHIASWIDWVNDGSSAGAADAHIVETDSNGDTAVQDLSAVDIQNNTQTVADVLRVENEIQADFLLQFGVPATPVTEAEITQVADTSQGADSRSGIYITARDGRDQAVAAGINNDGSQVQIDCGRPGTGLTTQDGGPGVIIVPDAGLSVGGVSGKLVQCVFCFNQSGSTVQYQMPRAMYDLTSFVGYAIAKVICTDDGGATAYISEAKFIYAAGVGTGATEDNYSHPDPGQPAWAPNEPVVDWQKPSATEMRLQIAEQSGGDISGTVHVTFLAVDYTP